MRALGFQPNGDRPQLYFPPLRHEGSHALYSMDFYTGDDRVLVSYLFPNAITTRHYHNPPITEDYIPIAGQLFLNNEPIPHSGLHVPSGMVHQASTRGLYAFTLIVMRNARLIPENQQHIKV